MPLLKIHKQKFNKKGSRTNALFMQKRIFINPTSKKCCFFQTKEALVCIRNFTKGSFTVEAALVLPFVMFVISAMLFFFQIMSVESAVSAGMTVAARQTAIYTQSISSKQCENETIQNALLLAYAGTKTRKEIEKLDAPLHFIKGGISGIHFYESDMSGDEIVLIAKYKIELPITIFGKRSFDVRQTSSSRKWTGASPRIAGDANETWVYITETGSSYHRTKTCTYLDLTIKNVSKESLKSKRNKSGARYKRCERCCKSENTDSYYITDYGTHYHASISCSGLKRTIYYRRLSELEGYTPCHKCYR